MTAPIVSGGLGATLAVGSGASLTIIAQIVSISGPDISQGTRETTVLNPPLGWRSFLPTISDGGTLSFQLFIDETQVGPSSPQTLFGMFGVIGGALWGWQVTTEDGHKFNFSGAATKFSVGEQTVESNLLADLEVKLSGTVLWS